MKEWTKAFKGFNADLTCSPGGIPFQYEEGKTYEEDTCKLCESGFHACEAPLAVFRYYPPNKSVYHQVELNGVSSERYSNTKICGTEIRIGERISLADLTKLQCEYVRKNCTNENNPEKGKPATAGDYGAATTGDFGAATAGDYGAATTGDFGAATAGDSGVAATGNYGAATAGDRGAATAGDYGAATAGDSGVAATGNYGAATAGDSGAAAAGSHGAATAGKGGAAAAGDSGAATSRGSVTVGENGVGTVRGKGVKIRGGIGALLVIAEEKEDSYDIVSWVAGVVDGEKIKADTWYCVKDGKFVEVE